MQSPFELAAGAISRRPALVAGMVACLLLLAFYGMTMTSMQTGYETYVDLDTERGILLEKYTGTFQSDSLMVLVEGDDVLDPAVLAYLDDLGAEIRTEQYVRSVSSIADLAREANGGVLPTSYADVGLVKERIPAEVLSRYVPSNMMTIAVVTLDPGLAEASQNQVVSALNTRVALSDVPPGVHVVVTGNAAFNQQMSQEMGTSMGTLIGAAMLLMVLAVGVLFGHVRYRFLPVAIVAAGLIATFGFIGLTGMKINMVTIAAFPVLIGIGIDYAIQFHSRFDEEARKGSLSDAVRNTITKAGPAVLYAMLATSMGFIAMWISPLPMIRSFGEVCVIGVVACYFAAIVIVPTVGLLLKYQPKPRSESSSLPARRSAVERYDEGVGSVVEMVAKRSIPVLLICGLVALGGWYVDGEIAVNTNEDTFVPPDMPALIDLNKVSRTMGPTSGMPVYIRGTDVVDLDTVRWMQEFQEYEATHNSQITGSRSIADVVLRYNGGEMPSSDAELAAVLDRIPEAEKKSYVNGRSEAIIEIFTVEMENDVGMSFVKQMQKELAWLPPPPGVTATITGTGEMFTNLITEIREGKLEMTLLGFSMIFGLLFLIFRRVGRAGTPLVPIVLIVGWNGLIMYVLGIDYTPMTATLGSMTIGVASEYTILIMERYYEECENGLSGLDAIRQSVQKIGTAITVSGLTTILGFSALMLSTFGIISNFGILTVISVGFALIGAIIIMPAILTVVGSLEHRWGRSKAEATT
ncbi:hydrogenase expression protein HypA [Methanoculleus taiwanensis]|uniref:Hydrogenase expression protein HypA n=1 Tax=Methanoculleus taiwanensis TaxID=1550565 RepID=A0A498H5F3_9EURY|nr:RND family transporter [Methanoculleus taiwanensis]RXE57208.1 hydrogenase expression protein HypA [Methanoculleus taiwanensis]